MEQSALAALEDSEEMEEDNCVALELVAIAVRVRVLLPPSGPAQERTNWRVKVKTMIVETMAEIEALAL